MVHRMTFAVLIHSDPPTVVDHGTSKETLQLARPRNGQTLAAWSETSTIFSNIDASADGKIDKATSGSNGRHTAPTSGFGIVRQTPAPLLLPVCNMEGSGRKSRDSGHLTAPVQCRLPQWRFSMTAAHSQSHSLTQEKLYIVECPKSAPTTGTKSDTQHRLCGLGTYSPTVHEETCKLTPCPVV
jgi:hypothetical protein